VKFVGKYNEILQTKGLKHWFRGSILTFLSLFKMGFKPLNRVHFLYIHHVFEDEEAAFIELLGWLKSNYHIISHSEGVNILKTGKIDKPYICLSSDDGFKNNLKAAQICHDHKVSMCFFVNPNLIGESNYDIIKVHCKTKLHLPPIAMLGMADIKTILGFGQEVGIHTLEHKHVSEMSLEEFAEDCKLSMAFCSEMEITKPHFAFPYGRHNDYSAAHHRIALKQGFGSISSAVRGYHNDIIDDDTVLHRDHIVLSWPMRHIKYFIASAKEVKGDWYNA
jgi:peptidoglycan/xylan/chitin deacetylase (PgdA/CDA1 family)